jgi:hypothetical protein
MLLITTFVELRLAAGRSRTRAGRPHAVSGRPMLIHTCHAHAALCRGLEKSLSGRHGRGMACVNQTRSHSVNQMGKTHSKPLAARHGRGTAWERHGMCELALRFPFVLFALHPNFFSCILFPVCFCISVCISLFISLSRFLSLSLSLYLSL